VISVLCSCGTEDQKRGEAGLIASDLSEMFDEFFARAHPPSEERKSDMKLAGHTLNGGLNATSDHVRVVRIDT